MSDKVRTWEVNRWFDPYAIDGRNDITEAGCFEIEECHYDVKDALSNGDEWESIMKEYQNMIKAAPAMYDALKIFVELIIGDAETLEKAREALDIADGKL